MSGAEPPTTRWARDGARGASNDAQVPTDETERCYHKPQRDIEALDPEGIDFVEFLEEPGAHGALPSRAPKCLARLRLRLDRSLSISEPPNFGSDGPIHATSRT